MIERSHLWTPSPLTRRRFLGVAGAAAVGGALAACGSNTGRQATAGTSASSSAASSSAESSAVSSAAGSSSSAGSSGVPSSSSASSAASSAAQSTGELPHLSQWYHQYGEKGTQQAVEGYAKAYDKATVSVEWTPGNYDGKVAAALLTDSGPDVFEAGNGPSIDAIQAGQVAALDGLLGDAESDFTSSLVKRMSYDGHLYGIPQVIDMQLLVYRKSMLDQAGLKPPQTFDELLAAAKALTNDKTQGLFVGNDGGGGVLAGPTLWSVGADYLTAANKVGFDDPNVAKAFGRLHELFTSGFLLVGAPTDWSDPSALLDGLTAMQWTGLWTLPALTEGLGDDFGVLPWPKFSATVGAPSVPIGAYGSAVSAKSKNVDAAKAYVKWLWVDKTDYQLDFAQSFGFHIPARESLAAKADKLKSGPAADAVTLVQKYGKAQTPILWTAASGTALSDAVSRIIKDGSDPAAELAKVKTTVEAELKRVLK